MKFKHSLKTAYRGLEQNRARSFLTMLGIVIGVTAIILVMSLGQGAQDLILDQVKGMGTRTIIVGAGRAPKGPSDAGQIFNDSLKQRDLEKLERREYTPSVKYVMPLIFGAAGGSYQSYTYNLTIFGASPLMMRIFDMPFKAGGMFTDEDIRARSKYVIIGNKVKTQLFGADEAIGQVIKMKGYNFRIIGVLAEQGQSAFNFDEAAIIPYTTAQDYVLGIKYFNRFIVEAESDALVPNAADEVALTLRESHNITDPTKDDFFVITQVSLAKSLSSITSVLTIFLAAVAAISLIVGGVGIMNIMLVSVTERTKEIGLRKALGATYQDILTQFLLEAVMLTGMGGLVGILLGAFLSWAIATGIKTFTEIAWTFTFPVSSAILGLGVSGAIGLIFGLYPARTAANKSPIDAPKVRIN